MGCGCGMPARGALVLALVGMLTLGWAPAPFPKLSPSRVPTLVGAWDVKWGQWDARLDLHRDGSARFAYVAGGRWNGTWKYDGKKKKVGLTLLINSQHNVYELSFDKVDFDVAEGRVRQGPFNEPLKLARAKRK